MGGFAPASTPDVPAYPDSIAAADLDRDGRTDLVVSSRNTPFVTLLLGDGSGGLTRRTDIAVDAPEDVLVADLDEDGRLDVAAMSAQGLGLRCSYVTVLHGDGDGGVTEIRRFSTGESYDGFDATDLAAADFDEDGHLDLVAQNSDALGSGNSSTAVLLNRTPFKRWACRKGNVNGGVGPVTDVLFVNGKRGYGPSRKLVVDRDESFTIRMVTPPSGAPAPFAL
ncbi:MAG: VCBS repeat-containing protein [Planctomycetes bacterium]|nr:VCBS repeat-containing protein [Planctomycetota bacterium]